MGECANGWREERRKLNKEGRKEGKVGKEKKQRKSKRELNKGGRKEGKVGKEKNKGNQKGN
jgi:hypothetical protein